MNPKGRADTDTKKREVIEKIFKIWTQHPELRLGQLLVNALKPLDKSPVIFYAEDDVLVKKMEEFDSKCKK